MREGRIGELWLPYCGAAPAPGELIARWNFDPWVLLALAAATALWLAAGFHRERGQAAAFAGAMAVLALLFVSPFCALTSALFAARAAHHALLVAVAAPLLAWSLPAAIPGAAGRVRIPLAAATGVSALILWLWHAPSLYAAALSSDALYWTMQASLLLSATAFWRAVRHAAMPAAVAALLATMVQMGLLGAILTFSGRAFYAPHWLTTQAWGYSPLEDQQLAGLVMSAPAAALYLAAALLIAGRWLAAESRSTA